MWPCVGCTGSIGVEINFPLCWVQGWRGWRSADVAGMPPGIGCKWYWWEIRPESFPWHAGWFSGDTVTHQLLLQPSIFIKYHPPYSDVLLKSIAVQTKRHFVFVKAAVFRGIYIYLWCHLPTKSQSQRSLYGQQMSSCDRERLCVQSHEWDIVYNIMNINLLFGIGSCSLHNIIVYNNNNNNIIKLKSPLFLSKTKIMAGWDWWVKAKTRLDRKKRQPRFSYTINQTWAN